MMDVMRGSQGEVVIRIDGTLDANAIARLVGWLGEIPRGEAVVLELGKARGCEDVRLAALARALAPRGRVVVHGLTLHQERMLRYCGVELGAREAEPERGVA